MANRHTDSVLEKWPRPKGKTAVQMGLPPDGPEEAEDFRTISLRALADILDTSRSSARRWLCEAGIRPIAIGRGRNGAIRYRWREVKAWLESRQRVE